MKVVTLKLKNQREWNFLRNILQRLKVLELGLVNGT